MSSFVGIDPERWPHGTRARYTVGGCRCDACRASNATRYRARRERVVELAGDVRPSGPPIPGTLRRSGREDAVLRCPGANGAACVATPPTWLRGGTVCSRCIERVTVWGGLVDATPARAHLLELRAAGVGYKTVSAASDVGHTVLTEILSGAKPRIRATTERRILAVDAGARADASLVDGRAARAAIARLVAKGFTREDLARHLGSSSRALQVGSRVQVLARTDAALARLERRAAAGEVAPRRAFVDAVPERLWVRTMLERGVPAAHLRALLGFHVQRGHTGRMRPENRDAVRELQRKLREDADTGLPENWMVASDVAGEALAGLAWTKDFSVRGRARAAARR